MIGHLVNIDAAIHAAAPHAPREAIEALRSLDHDDPILASIERLANTIGQCAHESVGFTRTVESLSYSADRLMAVWPNRFRKRTVAEQYARSPKKLANKVYGGRLGNKRKDDGWRYRGRGYIQLTGRANYIRFGRVIGVDLDRNPELAALPEFCWRLASAYLSTRTFKRKSALYWADQMNVEVVTRIVNGGFNGLEDRHARTADALLALGGMPDVLRLGNEGPIVRAAQQRLAQVGFTPGPIDGDFGPLTEKAVVQFQRDRDLVANGVINRATAVALGLVGVK